MNIFLDVPVESADATPEAAVLALLRRARAQELSTDEAGFRARRWSLAELQPDDDDYAWLCGWARRLDAAAVRKGLRTSWDQFHGDGLLFSAREALGWLLLLLASEAARRGAAEGESPWPAVRRDERGQRRFTPDTDHELFVRGRPTRLHREALEATAQRLHLRHAFSADGVAAIGANVFLQLGLTRRGCLARLHHWLDGHEVPDAFERLLRGPLESASFKDLYAHLYHFRHQNIPEQQLRDFLPTSPWVLPAWQDELVACCQKPDDYEPPLPGETLPDSRHAPVLRGPWLRWQGPAGPRFVAALRGEDELGLAAESYRLLVAGRRCAVLRRQPDGSYQARLAASDTPDEVALPVLAPEVSVALVADDGEVAQDFTLTLWDAEDDVTVYHLPDGRRLADPHAEPMDPAESYAVLAAPDLALRPGTPAAQAVPGPGENQFFLLPAGWPADTRLVAGEQEVWAPVLSDGGPPAEPDWAAEVTLTRRGAAGEVAPGDPLQLIINHPAEVVVGSVRVNGRAVPFTRSADTRTLTNEPVPFGPGAAEPRLVVRLGLARGEETCRAVRVLDLAAVGAARLDASVWVPLKGDEALTAEQARQSPVRLWLPPRRHGRPVGWAEWALVEGDEWLGRPPPLPRSLPEVTGAGAPLTVRYGPYNSFGDELRLAREVRDHGLLRDVALDSPGTPRSVRLELADEIVPSERHRVVWWDANGQRHDLTPAPVPPGAGGVSWWEVRLPEAVTRPLAVGIADNGRRLGAWYPHDWAELLQQAGPAGPAASLTRWFRLPLLQEAALPLVRSFALKEPGSVLAAWLTGGPPEGLTGRQEEEGWLSCLRAVFKDWQPDLPAVDALLDAIEEHTRISSLMVALALELMRIDPLLMGRAVRCYMQEHHQKKHGDKAAKTFLQQMTFDVAELPPGASRQLLRENRTALVWDCAAAMRVKDGVVRELLNAGVGAFNGTALEPAQRANLDLAIDMVVPFRRALGLAVLDAVAHSMTSQSPA